MPPPHTSSHRAPSRPAAPAHCVLQSLSDAPISVCLTAFRRLSQVRFISEHPTGDLPPGHPTRKVGVNPILQVEQLRLREAKSFAQDPTATRMQVSLSPNAELALLWVLPGEGEASSSLPSDSLCSQSAPSSPRVHCLSSKCPLIVVSPVCLLKTNC